MSILKPRFFYRTVIDFLQFVAHPGLSVSGEESVGKKVTASVFLLLIKFSFSILVASLIGLFYEPQNLTDQSMSGRFSPIMYLIVGGMLLPVFEEVLFRLSLIFKPVYLSLSTACATYYVLTKLVFDSKLSLVDDTFFIRVGVGVLVGIGCFFLLNSNEGRVQRIQDFWKNNFRFIYYGFAIVFAWLHILNFEVTMTNILLTPLLTLPQLFSALISGYLRVKFGFVYPLVLHICTNSLLIGLSILTQI